MEELVIWNPELDGVDNYLWVMMMTPPYNGQEILGYKKQSKAIFAFSSEFMCVADEVKDDSIFYYLFGFGKDPPSKAFGKLSPKSLSAIKRVHFRVPQRGKHASLPSRRALHVR